MKLNESKVRAIRQQALAGQLHVDIAARVGVCQTMVSRIVRGDAWRSVSGLVKRRLTESDRASICQDVANGMRQVDVAAWWGLAQTTVSAICRGQGKGASAWQDGDTV